MNTVVFTVVYSGVYSDVYCVEQLTLLSFHS